MGRVTRIKAPIKVPYRLQLLAKIALKSREVFKNKDDAIKIVSAVNKTFNPMTRNKNKAVSDEKPGPWDVFKKDWFSKSCKHKKKMMQGVIMMTSFLIRL